MAGMRGVNCGKDTLWIDGGWHTVQEKEGTDVNSSNTKEGSVIDYAEVDSCNLSTFYNPCKGLPSPGNPTPYATTILLSSKECNVSFTYSHVCLYSINFVIRTTTRVFFMQLFLFCFANRNQVKLADREVRRRGKLWARATPLKIAPINIPRCIEVRDVCIFVGGTSLCGFFSYSGLLFFFL